MKTTIQYIDDAAGQHTAVVVPYAAWEKMLLDMKRMRQKVRVIQGIRDGVKEVRAAREQNEPLQSLQAFLDEC